MRRRRRGEGSVYKRKDGRFETTIFMNSPEGIKRVSRYSYTLSEAEAKLVELRANNNSGLLTSSKEQKFGDWLDYWLISIRHSVRPSTFTSYETTVRLYLKPGLGRKYLTKLTVSDVQSFLELQSKLGKSIRNVQKMRIVLSAALERANYEERLNRNVARQTKIPTYKPKEVVPWDSNQLSTFLSKAKSSPYYPVFTLLSLYGLRSGEAIGLSWTDIDWDNKVIHIRHQIHHDKKTGYSYVDVKTQAGRRQLPLLESVAQVLVNIERTNEGPLPDLVFKTFNGLPIDNANLRRSFKLIGRQAHVPIITLHHLRHTAATNFKNLGIAPKDAQAILGHTNIATTLQFYQHADIRDKAKALKLHEQNIGSFLPVAVN